jgi:uncharacterized RDD family membrane protein YckC
MQTPQQGFWHLDEYTLVCGTASPGGRIMARQVAGIGARFLAGSVDFLIQCTLAAAVALVVYLKHPGLVAPQDRPWFFATAMLEWHVLYFVLFEAFTSGRTPGKVLVGIGVIDSRTGARPRPLQLLGRNLLRIIDILPLHYLAAAVFIATSPRRQRLGDRVFSTTVIYTASLVEQLDRAGVPESIYSTSEDGYLLQAFLRRSPALQESGRPFLTREVARFFQKKYAPTDAGLIRLYEQEEYAAYLQRLCDQETDAARLETPQSS